MKLRAWFALYFHTLRYLKPVQVWARVVYRLRSPYPGLRPSPPLRGLVAGWRTPIPRKQSQLSEWKFRFLSVEHEIASGEDWNSQALEKLWLYNLHYFDDLNARCAGARRPWHLKLLSRWIEENPPGVGVGWDPYPTSLRIVNWVKWHWAGNVLPAACVQSLAVQARWLMQRIEWHILGNHLFANAKALVFAGVFFSGEEADRWLQKGLRIIADELPEQVLADGGNFERSPMYHVIFAEDLLDLLNLAQAYLGALGDALVACWRKTSQSMLHWLEGLIHPDGEIAFFNDAAIGIAPTPAELFAYASRLGLRADPITKCVTHFPESGYVRLALSDAVALLDVAPVGPDYLPGHAHADTLSFELSLFGQRVFVNGGTSEYGAGEIRQLERSTAAHNTVVVNGENSSQVWGGFRVARRAYPCDLRIKGQSDSVTVTCAHDGYRSLLGKPTHHRSWQLSGSAFIVYDKVDGQFDYAVAYFHLHPSVTVSSDGAGGWKLQLLQGQKVTVKVEMGEAQWMTSHYAPEFGKRLLTQCLQVILDTDCARVLIEWGFDA